MKYSLQFARGKSVLFFLSLVVFLGISGCCCPNEPCQNVTCLNGGECSWDIDGCECVGVYGGTDCSQFLNQMISGSWQFTEQGTVSGNRSYTVVIAAANGTVDSFYIVGLHNEPSTTVIAGFGNPNKSFTIPRQVPAGQAQYASTTANVSYDVRSLELTYQTFNDSTATVFETCTVTATKL